MSHHFILATIDLSSAPLSHGATTCVKTTLYTGARVSARKSSMGAAMVKWITHASLLLCRRDDGELAEEVLSCLEQGKKRNI